MWLTEPEVVVIPWQQTGTKVMCLYSQSLAAGLQVDPPTRRTTALVEWIPSWLWGVAGIYACHNASAGHKRLCSSMRAGSAADDLPL